MAVLPAPASTTQRQKLRRVLTGRGAVVGPARPWRAAPDSLRPAVLARDLLAREAPDAEGPLWVADHLLTLVLHAEPTLLQDLATRRLAPLDTLRAGQQERLCATLLSWLQHHGHRAAMAAELGIHEQTVGYRINQLREIFGEDLNDPRARFELELVLRAGEGRPAPRPEGRSRQGREGPPGPRSGVELVGTRRRTRKLPVALGCSPGTPLTRDSLASSRPGEVVVLPRRRPPAGAAAAAPRSRVVGAPEDLDGGREGRRT